jgi:hypothetical protein
MNRTRIVLGMCCLTVLIAGVAIGQQGDKPGMKSMPKMTPEQQKEMQAWQEAATPGPMHEWLVQGCGTWEGKVKMWESPDGPATESTCTTIITPMMEGKFVKVEVKGMMKMGEMEMPFEGFGVTGYDNTGKTFQSTWCDSLGTMMLHSTGSLSADKKVLTLMSEKFTCPVNGPDCWMREVHTRTGPDSETLAMFGPDKSGKQKEYKIMEISYTRKAGTAPAPTMKKPMSH